MINDEYHEKTIETAMLLLAVLMTACTAPDTWEWCPRTIISVSSWKQKG